jgi:hypothetical protein
VKKLDHRLLIYAAQLNDVTPRYTGQGRITSGWVSSWCALGGNSGRSSQVHRAQSDSECRAAPLRRTTFVAVGTTVSGVEWLAVHADDEPRAIDNRADPVMRGAVRFRLNGTDYELSGAAVQAAAARGTPEPLLEHWVAAGGRRWPPKQLFEDATGIPAPSSPPTSRYVNSVVLA